MWLFTVNNTAPTYTTYLGTCVFKIPARSAKLDVCFKIVVVLDRWMWCFTHHIRVNLTIAQCYRKRDGQPLQHHCVQFRHQSYQSQR